MNMKISKNKRNTEVRVLAKNLKMSTQKMRRVIDQIRGCSYAQAYTLLKLMPYRACYPIFQLLCSAGANAKNNLGLKEKFLFISRAEVNEGTVSKKYQIRAKGRSFRIKKKTCHITIVLKELSNLIEFEISENLKRKISQYGT
uniref:Large ribosomal subunit protein uL22c n=20 Tax=Ephedra TaxID=3387 RepID=A0A0U3T674_9SPER|nr:ribosomal protein L22 [Ephedra foeminea]ALV90176.1 ribosomal protein L22 [Ephedra foeminea]